MLAVLPEMLRTARFHGGRMEEVAGGFALATELADFLAAKGVPFREAHHAIGRLVRRCEELGVSLEDVPQDELAAAHPALSEVPEGLLTVRGSVHNKISAGSTGAVDEQLGQAKVFLETMGGLPEGQTGPLSEGSDR
jgi:argininosuccinate lyase